MENTKNQPQYTTLTPKSILEKVFTRRLKVRLAYIPEKQWLMLTHIVTDSVGGRCFLSGYMISIEEEKICFCYELMPPELVIVEEELSQEETEKFLVPFFNGEVTGVNGRFFRHYPGFRRIY